MSTFAKYMERYKTRLHRSKDPPSPSPSPPREHHHPPRRLSTDRNAYVSYLEEQVERAHHQHFDLQHFVDRTQRLEAQQLQTEEKLASALKVLKLLQSGEDSHSDSLMKLKARLSSLEMTAGPRSPPRAPPAFPDHLEDRIARLQKKIASQEIARLSPRGRGGVDQAAALRGIQAKLEEVLGRERLRAQRDLDRLEEQLQAVAIRSAKGVDADLLAMKLGKIENTMNSYYAELESQMKNLQVCLDQKAMRKDVEHLRRVIREARKGGAGGSGKTTAREPGLAYKDDLKVIRNQVNKNVQDGVDRMGNLVRQYLSSLKYLENRVNVMEKQHSARSPRPTNQPPPAALPPRNRASLRGSQDLQEVVSRKPRRSMPQTVGCSPSQAHAPQELVSKLSPISVKNQFSILSSENDDSLLPHLKERRERIKERVSRQPLHTRPTERNLSRGARVLRDSLEKMSRSHSYRKNSRGSRTLDRSAHRTLDRSANHDLDEESFARARPPPMQRRLGGMTNVPRDSSLKPRSVSFYDSFPPAAASRSPVRNRSYQYLREARSFSRDRLMQARNITKSTRHDSNRSLRSFSFSPYSTKRSRMQELQARLKRDKDAKKKIISELVAKERQFEVRGRGAYSRGVEGGIFLRYGRAIRWSQWMPRRRGWLRCASEDGVDLI